TRPVSAGKVCAIAGTASASAAVSARMKVRRFRIVRMRHQLPDAPPPPDEPPPEKLSEEDELPEELLDEVANRLSRSHARAQPRPPRGPEAGTGSAYWGKKVRRKMNSGMMMKGRTICQLTRRHHGQSSTAAVAARASMICRTRAPPPAITSMICSVP